MGNFACIKNRVFTKTASLDYEYNFHCVHIFADIQEMRITRKNVKCEKFLLSQYPETWQISTIHTARVEVTSSYEHNSPRQPTYGNNSNREIHIRSRAIHDYIYP